MIIWPNCFLRTFYMLFSIQLTLTKSQKSFCWNLFDLQFYFDWTMSDCMVFNTNFNIQLWYIMMATVPIHAFFNFMSPVIQTIFSPSVLLLSHTANIETMVSKERNESCHGDYPQLLVTSNFSFSHNVFHSYISLMCQNVVLCGNGLIFSQMTNFLLFKTERVCRQFQI